ncbi:MAG TPA: Holliday junction resolvase RuvX [Alphaproteobacteria bacterium]|jgi:putative Holliday junction resolvase|nr:Holliday junction resolvase RuvX [Alphaproteobacteria bacterium]
MTLMSLDALAAGLPASCRLIGLDPGSKTVGVALSDLSRIVASPAEHLKRGKFADLAARIETLVKAEDVGGLIVGLPLNMDGSAGPSAQSARQFAENLAARLNLPVALWDERLSTAAVERGMIDADLSRRRRAELVDKLAAAYILQGALDYLARGNRETPR